jgi:hypothetical protein
MARTEKRKPTNAPGPPSLAENLTLALKDSKVRRSFRVKLAVHGGVRGQDYSFEFSATGKGTAQCQFGCALSGRSGESGKSSLTDKDFLSLLRKLQKTQRLPHEQPKFLPDTVVGVLEVSDGVNVRRYYFAADPEQAKTQDKTPPPELLQAVNAIYSIGAKLTGSRSTRP